MTTIETEAKFTVDKHDYSSLKGDAIPEQLISVYYDDGAWTLADAGITLRARYACVPDRHPVLTLKTPRKREGAIWEAEEYDNLCALPIYWEQYLGMKEQLIELGVGELRTVGTIHTTRRVEKDYTLDLFRIGSRLYREVEIDDPGPDGESIRKFLEANRSATRSTARKYQRLAEYLRS